MTALTYTAVIAMTQSVRTIPTARNHIAVIAMTAMTQSMTITMAARTHIAEHHLTWNFSVNLNRIHSATTATAAVTLDQS